MNVVSIRPQLTDEEVCIARAESLSKKLCRNLKFSLIYAMQDLLLQLCARPLGNTLKKFEFWALRDINLEINAGETIAIIGRNGAGKTTLLKLLAGLIKPNQGSISVRGRVVALISLGAGFSPYLSGRENADAFLTLLGVTANKRRELLADIFSFAELILFQNDPLSSYSSGMTARLAFACAVFAEPDILLIDEVLAVGDLSFHLRCYQKLAELKRKGTSIVLVSHNLTSVITLSDRVIYLERGSIKCDGDPATVCSRYEQDLRKNEKFSHICEAQNKSKNHKRDHTCSLSNFKTISDYGSPLRCGFPGGFVVEVNHHDATQNLALTLLIKQSAHSGYVLFLSSEDSQEINIQPGVNRVTISLPSCGLLPGHYHAKVSILDKQTREILAIQDWQPFEVVPGKSTTQSNFFQPSNWSAQRVG